MKYLTVLVLVLGLVACDSGGSVKQKPKDTKAPTLSLVGDAEITIAHGSTYKDKGATTDDGKIFKEGSVDTSKIGAYTVIYKATDKAGNKAKPVTRTIHVTDQTPPVITLKSDEILTVPHGAVYTDAGAKVVDAVDGDSTLFTNEKINISKVGSYILKFNASDKAGNKAKEVTRTVNVTDQTAPIISLKGLALVNIFVGNEYIDSGATVEDAVDGTSSITTADVVDTTKAGSYTLTYKASDKAGNNAIAVTRTIEVSLPEGSIFTPLPREYYYFEVDEEERMAGGKIIFGKDYIMTEISFYFTPQGEFVENPTTSQPNYEIYTLEKGVWEKTILNNSFELASNETVATFKKGTFAVTITDVEKPGGTKIKPFLGSDLEVSMPEGAQKTNWDINTVDNYFIQSKASTVLNIPNQEYYQTFEEVIQHECGTSSNLYVDSPQIGIDKIAFTCGQENQTSGTLVGVKPDNTLIENIGSWEIKNLPESAEEAIIFTLNKGYKNIFESVPIFATKNKEIWKGAHETTRLVKQVSVYNQVVFDAIQESLTK